MSARRTRAFVGAALVVVVLLLGILRARPAAAHSQLTETEPAASAVLEAAPKRVVLRFNEAVTVPTGAIRLYDAEGERLDDGNAAHLDGGALTAFSTLPSLDAGAYVVTWRVVSADGHPVQGAFTFRVGSSSAATPDSLAARLLASRGGSAVTGAAFAIARAALFGGFVVLLGLGLLLAVAWPEGLGTPRTKRLVVGAALAMGVASLLGVGLQGAYGGGLPLADAFRPAVIRAGFDGRYGRAAAARIVLLLAFLPVVLRLLRTGPLPRWWRPVAAVGAVALAASLTLGGHATTGEAVPVGIAMDLAHVLSASAWLGGIVGLLVLVLPAATGPDLQRAATRVSKTNLVAVGVLVASGLVQSWRQVGTFGAVGRTDYGKVLAVKTGVVAAMVGLGWLARTAMAKRWNAAPKKAKETEKAVANKATEARQEKADRALVARMRKTVGLEVLLALAVVSLTAVLVEAQPSRTADARPFAITLRSDAVLVDLSVEPAKVGQTDIHLYMLTPAGAQLDVPEATVELRQPSKGIGPLDIHLTRVTAGHWATYGATLPLPGRWEIDTKVRTSDVDQSSWTTSFTVR